MMTLMKAIFHQMMMLMALMTEEGTELPNSRRNQLMNVVRL